MTVPFLDVGAAYRELRSDVDAAIQRTLASGRYVLGAELSRFEQEFAAYTGSTRALGVANGLDALYLALRAAGVGAGDEVIVPANTFVATWLAVSYVGAVPVPVEPHQRFYNITADAVAGALTPRTRAVVPVHLYGQPAEMDDIVAATKGSDVFVLEDAAQAHGARYRGRPVGALGDAAAWSFYPGKNLGAFGDGGAVTVRDPALGERIAALRNYGSATKYVHEVRGTNSRLDELQAAVLSVKLSALDRWNARRRKIAGAYDDALHGTGVGLPEVAPGAEPVWHLYVVRVPSGRDAFRDQLARRGVETGVHYPLAPHLQPAYRDLGFASGDFPVSEALQREVVSLPMGPHMTDAEVDRVICAVREVCHAGAA